MIDKKILNELLYLELIYDKKIEIDFKIFNSLKCLKIVNYPFNDISIFNYLEYFELNYCKKIVDLNFLNQLAGLKHIKLSYLPMLRDIMSLEKFSQQLEKIDIIDCKKIDNIEKRLSKLKKLKEIQLITENVYNKLNVKSLNFINELSELEGFSTNYKIFEMENK